MSITLKQRRDVTRIVIDGVKVLSGDMPYTEFNRSAPTPIEAIVPAAKPAHVESKVLSSVGISTVSGGIAVSSPFNSEFVSAARKLNGKFSGGKWVFDSRLESDVRKALTESYGSDGTNPGDFVRLKIEWKDREFAGTSAIEVNGRSIARAYGRDSNAKTADGVIIRNGGFTSGGSMKNWGTIAKDETVVEMLDFPLAAAEKLVSEQPDEDRVYSIVGETMDSVAVDGEEWMTADDEYDAEYGVWGENGEMHGSLGLVTGSQN